MIRVILPEGTELDVAMAVGKELGVYETIVGIPPIYARNIDEKDLPLVVEELDTDLGDETVEKVVEATAVEEADVAKAEAAVEAEKAAAEESP